MNKEKLAEALNEISDRHIAEAARAKKKHRGLRRFAAMAAILFFICLVAAAAGGSADDPVVTLSYMTEVFKPSVKK